MKTVNPSLSNLTSFLEDCRIATYGDDVMMAISLYASKFYNGIVLEAEFKKLGFNAQAADKENKIVAIKKLSDCIFLSRGFEFKHGIWVGPLKYDNLCKPTHYSSDRRSHHFWLSPDEEIKAVDIVQNVYEGLLYNAAISGPETFAEFYDVAEKVMIETNGPPLPTYADALHRLYALPEPSEGIPGVELIHIPEVLTSNWKHSIPPNFKKMSNRVTYNFGPQYSYTGAPDSNDFPKNLKEVLEIVNAKLNKNYNSILVNRYPIGGGIPWHKDTEQEVDQDEGVFGITMQGDGRIEFKNAYMCEGMYLDPGLGYLMSKDNLSQFFHRRVEHFKETITFTFRKIVPRQ